ncbi:hypothetical protein Celaphus_00009690 [Cervus elaphus hippelaphus]|uniref:Uncharacterized protein n=1 Tax=Cervus elaphus hippelaphus TaxID=46360 RepID=A0A212C0S1_CEREH|nr:hypothetical protein Celaphus_00009690 [Cervus elaphus hippelaphus]
MALATQLALQPHCAFLIARTGGQRPPPPDSTYSTAIAGLEGALHHALLQTAITFCLEQLSLVMWTLQHFVPPLFAQSQHRRGP